MTNKYLPSNFYQTQQNIFYQDEIIQLHHKQ